MVSKEKKLGSARLIMLMTGAILFSLVLAFSSAPAAKADESAPNIYEAVPVDLLQDFRTAEESSLISTGQTIKIVSEQKKDDGTPTPTDAPFDTNIQVWGDTAQQSRPSVVVNPNNGDIWVAYQHFNGADWDIYLGFSIDDGMTWTNGAFVNTAANEINPSLAVTSTGVFGLVYQQDGDPNRLYFGQSTDDGASWNLLFIDVNSAFGGTVTNIEFPRVATQTTVGNYPNGLAFVLQAWCTDPANCGGGAHVIIWWGSSDWSVASPLLDIGGYYYYPWVTRTGNSQIFVDSLHPSVAWSDAGYDISFDDEWYQPGAEWVLVFLAFAEDGSPPPGAGWLITGAPSQAGIYSDIEVSGTNSIVAGPLLNASRFPGNPGNHNVVVYSTTDNWGNIDAGYLPLDTATTDQRAVSLGATTGSPPIFHLTYYSDAIMTDWWTDDVALTMNGPQKVSDNAGSAVNDDLATSVFMDAFGAPRVAWQDDRDGDVNIYTTAYITHQFWINATCGGVATPLWVLIDGTNYVQTPYTGRWPDGTTHIVTVTPTTQSGGFCTNCVFNQWDDGSTSATRSVTISADLEMEAIFDGEYRVQVSANPSGIPLNVTFDGITQPDQVVAFRVPGTYQAQAPTPQVITPGNVRYVFDDWDDSTTDNPKDITVGTTCFNITANFHVEYLITIDTNPSGLGLLVGYDPQPLAPAPVSFWAVPGSSVTLNTTSPQPGAPGERYKFARWAGGPFTETWTITVPGGPTTYIANFEIQFRITIDANYVSPGPDVGTDIPDCDSANPGPAPLICWADNNTPANLILTSPQVAGGGRYVFLNWNDGNTQLNRPIGPVTASATYLSIWSAEFYLTMTLDSATCQNQGTLIPGSGWHPQGNNTQIDWIPPTGIPPGERYTFWRWEGTGDGNYSGMLKSTSVIMNGPITETAFCHHQFEISVDTSPAGRTYSVDSAVHSNPQTFWFDYGTQHWLNTSDQTGAANTRYNFTQWSDANPNPERTILVTTSGTYTAFFDTQYRIVLSPLDKGDIQCVGGVGDCWYVDGTSATVQLTTPWAPTGVTWLRYVFNGWSGDATGTTVPLVLTMDSPKTINAAWITEYKLTVTTAQSTATCAPNANCWFGAGSQATVTLSELTVAGGTGTQYVFDGWTGDATGTAHPLTITMDGPRNVTATWQTQYELTIVSICGSTPNCGNPTGAGWYDEGAVATITLTSPFDAAEKTWEFDQWTGDATGTNTTVSVTMNAPKTVTATWNEVIPKEEGIELWVWLLIIIIIIVVVVLVAILFLMKRKKPVAEEEEFPEESPPPPPATK